MTKRIFIAVPPPPGIEKFVASVRRRHPELLATIRFVRPGRHHITLCFMDRAKAEDLGKVYAVCDDLASRYHPFEVHTDSWMAFPSLAHARSIAVAVVSENLRKLASQLTDRLKRHGFKLEDTDYVPHLTVGRVLGNHSVDATALARIESLNLKPYTISSMNVIESIPSDNGFDHQTLKEFIL